jgi:hypothetical protein
MAQSTPAKEMVRLTMTVLVSVVILGSIVCAMFFNPQMDEAYKRMLCGFAGTVVGFWLK